VRNVSGCTYAGKQVLHVKYLFSTRLAALPAGGRAVLVVRVVFSIKPVANQTTVVRESREGPLVRERDGKGPACRKAEGLSVLWGHLVAVPVRLHPLLVTRQVLQRVNSY